MVENSSHYEYLATYVDDILIGSKDPMAVIMSLEKTFKLKCIDISEKNLNGNMKFGEAWKNHGLGLDLSAKIYIQYVILKFEGLLKKSLSLSRHP
jgi:hypothetical protein